MIRAATKGVDRAQGAKQAQEVGRLLDGGTRSTGGCSNRAVVCTHDLRRIWARL